MRLKWIFSGVLLSVIMAAIFMFLIALAEYFTSLGEGLAMILVYVAMAISVFAGAFFAVRKSGTKALPTAMTVALLLIIALVVASFATNGAVSTNTHFISIIIGIVLASFLGALLGK